MGEQGPISHSCFLSNDQFERAGSLKWYYLLTRVEESRRDQGHHVGHTSIFRLINSQKRMYFSYVSLRKILEMQIYKTVSVWLTYYQYSIDSKYFICDVLWRFIHYLSSPHYHTVSQKD